MEDILDQVKKLSADELRTQLKEYGETVGPILPTTISLFQKRLARKILASHQTTSTTISKPSIDDSAVTSLSKGKEGKNDRCINGAVVRSTNSQPESSTASNGLASFKIVPEGEKSQDNKTKINLEACHFYGISLPATIHKEEIEDKCFVFTDKDLALKTVKKYTGARFKVFKSKPEADEFSLNSADVNSPWKKESKGPTESSFLSTGVSVESCPFKAPKIQELTALRKKIEQGECRVVENMFWENPRLLISSGDTPVILQESSRYNALHVAAKNNQAAMCQLILDTLEDPNLIDKLYAHTNETQLTRTNRINFVVDLYLNTPDKGSCESPLHFACKFGHKDVVSVIVSHPKVDRFFRNNYGQTAADVICSRCTDPDENLKDEIKELLEGQYYVPLVRSEDNTTQPVIGPPWSPDSKNPAMNVPFSSWSPKDPLMAVKACAGPMTPSRAEQFHKQWTTPPSGSPDYIRRKFVITRREDSDKGMERLGRDLAHQMQVPWLEYWEFLQTYADLSSEDGLDLLEEYFQKQRIALCIADGIEKLDQLAVSHASVAGSDIGISQYSNFSWNLLALREEVEKDLESSDHDNDFDSIDLDEEVFSSPKREPQLQNGGACKVENGVGSLATNGTPPSMRSSYLRNNQNLYSTPVGGENYGYGRAGFLNRSMERSDLMFQSTDSMTGNGSPISCLSALFAKLSLLDRSRSSPRGISKFISCTSCMGNRSQYISSPGDYPMDASYVSVKPYSKIPYFKEANDTYNAHVASHEGSESVTQSNVPVSVWKRPPLTKIEREELESEKLKVSPGAKSDMNWRSSKPTSFGSESDPEPNLLTDSQSSELDDSINELTNNLKKVELQEGKVSVNQSEDGSSIDWQNASSRLNVTLEMDRDKISGIMFESLFETLNERKNLENVSNYRSAPIQTRQDIVVDLKEELLLKSDMIVADVAVIPFHCSVAEMHLFNDIPFKVIQDNPEMDKSMDMETHLPAIIDVKFNFIGRDITQALTISNSLKSKMFFIHGYRPTKSDLDAYRAMEGATVDNDRYPTVQKWRAQVLSYATDSTFSWQSPAKVRKQSNLSSSFPLGSAKPQSDNPITFSPVAPRSPRHSMTSSLTMPNIRTQLFSSSGPKNRWSMIN
ncbi:ankyrin repeat and LEM domain-containing protein 2-like [Ylistrum balloti]|uniref:ankyrin repeat and LEM domain-containing protein 2-like n=1 Tax=Ylistrum balloti TaxID=509963 RepID=UPI002905B197|nr:ankyrin repeat and LEM domain-containing protein 2-like [Ylistrum balloti]